MAKKQPKLYECDVANGGERCGRKFKSGSGGRLATADDQRNLCPMHTQRLIRDGDTGPVRKILTLDDPAVPVKAFVSPALKKEITKRAKSKDQSISEFIGEHLRAVFKPA